MWKKQAWLSPQSANHIRFWKWGWDASWRTNGSKWTSISWSRQFTTFYYVTLEIYYFLLFFTNTIVNKYSFYYTTNFLDWFYHTILYYTLKSFIRTTLLVSIFRAFPRGWSRHRLFLLPRQSFPQPRSHISISASILLELQSIISKTFYPIHFIDHHSGTLRVEKLCAQVLVRFVFRFASHL